MRITSIARGVIVALIVASSAQAQTPPDQSIGGQVQGALAYGTAGNWCYIAQGATQFQRNGAGPTAVLSLPEVIYFDGGTYFPLSGQTRLTFSNTTSGTIKFKLWGSTIASNSSQAFVNYSETFNGQQYLVNFDVSFPNNCTVHIYASYEAP
jgi:hypothetical protein